MPIIVDNTSATTILVSDLLQRLDDLMSDDERVRWTQAERIRWFNDAAKEIVLRRPSARAVTSTVVLVEGTFQNTPSGTMQLLNVMRNMTAEGRPGRSIGVTDMQLLSDVAADWHMGKAGETRQYMIDDRSPTTFYVYPPAVAGATVEALLAMPPPEVTLPEEMLDMRAEFIGPIINWALYRCHTKDSEYSNAAIAGLHYQAFKDAIGEPQAAASANSPKKNSI